MSPAGRPSHAPRTVRRVAAAGLCCAAFALAPREARADAYQDHLDHAASLAQGERYKEALAELEAAYALRQSPRLLYMMAKMQQRLGAADAALGNFERFLTADAEPDPRIRADTVEQIAKLRQLLGKDPLPAPRAAPPMELPPVDRPPLDVHYEMKPSVGLIAGGSVLFGAAYLGAVVTGAIFLEPNSVNCFVSCNGSPQIAGGMLLIPVAGPFMSALMYREPVWSITWSLVDGVAQVGGVAMIAYAATHPKKVPVYGERFQLLPYAGAGRGGLQVAGRF